MMTRWGLSALVVSVCTLMDARAATLDDVLAQAIAADPAIAAALATADGGDGDVAVARAALLPRVTAAAGYTRNQVAAEVELPGQDPVVITPLDQLNASIEARWTVVDAAAWSSWRAAQRCREASSASAADVVDQALLEVARLAWDLRSAEVKVAADEAALAASTAVWERAVARRDAGAGSVLDALVAEGDVARAQEELALSTAEQASLRRALEARTGPVDALVLQARPVSAAEGEAAAVEAARAQAACDASRRAARSGAYAPTVDVFARESLSNAVGFAGRGDVYAAGVEAKWTLYAGGARAGQWTAADAAARAAASRATGAERDAARVAADALGDQAASEVALAAAQARRAASDEAARVALVRNEEGAADVREVTAALRDQRDAALGLARAEARFAVAAERARVAVGAPMLVGGAR
jgi:outer membrane protein TolC